MSQYVRYPPPFKETKERTAAVYVLGQQPGVFQFIESTDVTKAEFHRSSDPMCSVSFYNKWPCAISSPRAQRDHIEFGDITNPAPIPYRVSARRGVRSDIGNDGVGPQICAAQARVRRQSIAAQDTDCALTLGVIGS